MSRELTIPCPACRKSCMPGETKHDEDLNLICPGCGVVLFAATLEAESKVKRADTFVRKEPLPIKQAIGEIPYETRSKRETSQAD